MQGRRAPRSVPRGRTREAPPPPPRDPARAPAAQQPPPRTALPSLPNAQARTRQLRFRRPPTAPAPRRWAGRGGDTRGPRGARLNPREAGSGALGGGPAFRKVGLPGRAESPLARLPPRRRSDTVGRPVSPSGDLQTEAGVAFRMQSGLAGRWRLRPKEAARVGACVVGSLPVPPDRGHAALRGPAFGPAPRVPASFRMPGAGWQAGGGAWRAGPASAASNWAWMRPAPPAAFPLGRASQSRVPLGRADLGTKFKDFKSTSWRLLEARTLRSGCLLPSPWESAGHLKKTPPRLPLA